MRWQDNDELARELMREGVLWERLLRTFLLAHGLPLRDEQEFTWRKDKSEIDEFSRRQQDVVVDIPERPYVIEVKSRDLCFASPSNYPYPSIFIDTVESWESKEVKPDAYVVISRITGCMLYLPTSGAEFWDRVHVRDSVRKIPVLMLSARRSQARHLGPMIEAIQAEMRNS